MSAPVFYRVALKQRLQAQIDSACVFGVWYCFMRLRAFSCGQVKRLRKWWSSSCGQRWKYAFTCVCVYNRLCVYGAQIWCLESKKNGNKLEYSPDLGSKFSITMGSRYLIIREIQSKCLAIKWESNLTHWLLYLIMTKFCQALFHFLPYNKSS